MDPAAHRRISDGHDHARISSSDLHHFKRRETGSDGEDSQADASAHGAHMRKKQKRSSGKACVYCRRRSVEANAVLAESS